jgi:CheY-like chemotaxis protein
MNGEAPMPSDDGVPTSPPPHSTEPDRRVLVIDDERYIGAMISRLLEPLPVVFAQSAAGALGRVEAGARFAAIVCDIRMPGIDGMQFYDAVRALAPSLARRIVYITGSEDSPEIREFLARSGCRCIGKPFDGPTLRAAVTELLSSGD